MPPIIIAFWILMGATLAPPLVKGLDPRQDRSSHSSFGKPAPQAYRTWTSVPWTAQPNPSSGTCDVTYFALATRSTITRLVAGGKEQLLDWSWSLPRVLRAGETRAVVFEFRDPRSGALLSKQVQRVICLSSPGVPETIIKEGDDSEPVAPVRKVGKARLVAVAPALSMFDSGLGGAFVDVEFKVVGDVAEAWYCPGIVVEWPDGTRTERSSDCAPFEDRDPEQVFKWKFTRGFSGGEWVVKACIVKSGKTLACTEARVLVVGG